MEEDRLVQAPCRLDRLSLTRRDLLQKGPWLAVPLVAPLPSYSLRGIAGDSDVPTVLASPDEEDIERRELVKRGLAFFFKRKGQERPPVSPFVLPPSANGMLEDTRATFTELLSRLLSRWAYPGATQADGAGFSRRSRGSRRTGPGEQPWQKEISASVERDGATMET
jgi:hypothetical protein